MLKLAEPIALVDMDGTIADFDMAMQRDLAPLASPNDPDLNHSPDDAGEPPWLKARKKLIKNQPNWWRNLARMELNFHVVDLMQDMSFDIHILTKGPWRTTSAWSQKVEWCREHVPYASVHITEDKGLMYGKILMDDWPPYIERWLQWRPRGLVIMPAQRWNKDFSHPNVVRWERWNAEEVFDRIWEVRQTCQRVPVLAPSRVSWVERMEQTDPLGRFVP